MRKSVGLATNRAFVFMSHFYGILAIKCSLNTPLKSLIALLCIICC